MAGLNDFVTNHHHKKTYNAHATFPVLCTLNMPLCKVLQSAIFTVNYEFSFTYHVYI